MPRIHADFEKISEARKAIEALKEAGFKGACLDVIDKYFDEFSAELNIAGTGSGVSLASLVLKSGRQFYEVEKTPLIAAADPMVSGLGSFEEIADANTRLVINVEAGREKEAKKLLSDMGGII